MYRGSVVISAIKKVRGLKSDKDKSVIFHLDRQGSSLGWGDSQAKAVCSERASGQHREGTQKEGAARVKA